MYHFLLRVPYDRRAELELVLADKESISDCLEAIVTVAGMHYAYALVTFKQIQDETELRAFAVPSGIVFSVSTEMYKRIAERLKKC